MNRLRVLIIDDEEPVRRFLRRELGRDAGLNVVGTAEDAETALSLVQQLKPDVVTLDIGMPGVSGLDLLIQLKALRPRLPIVMFSGLSLDMESREVIELGADAIVEKPARAATREDLVRHIKEYLVPRIKAVAGRPSRAHPSAPLEPRRPHPPRPSTALAVTKTAVDVLAVGSSAGGPDALAALFSSLPANLPVPVVVVQHMPADFTRLLAERLTQSCPLDFFEAKDGDELTPGNVFIAPGDYHMRVVRQGTRSLIALDRGPKVQSVRPAVDVLFQSVADVYAGRCLAVVLTGMGRDGVDGCQRVRERAGQVIVQDEASSVVWGMPGAVANAGLAQAVLPLSLLAGETMRRIARGSAYGSALEEPTRERPILGRRS